MQVFCETYYTDPQFSSHSLILVAELFLSTAISVSTFKILL